MLEIVFVMALLGLFGITTYTLVMTGADTYSRLLNERDDNSNLRVAVSFISMKIRQNDVEGTVGIVELSSGTALSIKEVIEDEIYETLVYQYDGAVYELFHEYGDDLDVTAGEKVSDIGGMRLTEIAGGGIKIEVNTLPDWNGVSLEAVIGCRSS